MIEVLQGSSTGTCCFSQTAVHRASNSNAAASGKHRSKQLEHAHPATTEQSASSSSNGRHAAGPQGMTLNDAGGLH